MGANDGDVPYAHTTPKKLVTMHSFYIDQTEITNSEYRQFVHWVRDSLARTLLAENFDEETLGGLRDAYRTVYRRGLSLKEAKDRLAILAVDCDATKRLLSFIESSSRGIARATAKA